MTLAICGSFSKNVFELMGREPDAARSKIGIAFHAKPA